MNGSGAAPELASSAASGVSATTVPTEVPIDSDMKHAATKSPGTTICGGSHRRVSDTVASTDPVSLASEANAPARMNTHIMYMMLGLPAAREKVSMRS